MAVTRTTPRIMDIDPSAWQPQPDLPRRGMKVASLHVVDGHVVGVYLEPMGLTEPDPPEGDPLPGPCQVGRHQADHTWMIPNSAKLTCAFHLREVLRRAAFPWALPPMT